MSNFDFTKFTQTFLDIHDYKFIPWSTSLHDSFSIDDSSSTITLYLTTSLSKTVCPRCGCIDAHYFKDYRTITPSIDIEFKLYTKRTTMYAFLFVNT